VVGHLDLDYFYAQVEEMQNPSLRSKPVVVCVFSGRTELSGVVSTANYKARDLGAKSGMPISLARKKLDGTDAVFIPMDRHRYEAVSQHFMDVVKENVDLLEKTGIDECYFDLTKSSAGDYTKARLLALALKKKVMELQGLTCSIGIAPNKVVAKIASDFQKPDGLTVVTDKDARDFLAPLDVEKLQGVGPKTAEILRGAGITTLDELAGRSVDELESLFSRKLAVYLRNSAQGIDNEVIVPAEPTTQLGRIITLKRNSREQAEILQQLSPAISDLHERLSSKHLSFQTVTVTGVLTDLSIKTRSRKLDSPANDLKTIETQAGALLEELTNSAGLDLRRAGVRVSDLVDVADQAPLTSFIG
jgi:DNA polymerase IV (DinB-like DNA polymerase)